MSNPISATPEGATAGGGGDAPAKEILSVCVIWNGCQHPYMGGAFTRLVKELSGGSPEATRIAFQYCGHWRPLSGGAILVGGRPVWANPGAPPSAAVEDEVIEYARTRSTPPLDATGKSANGVHWAAPISYTGRYPSVHDPGCSAGCQEAGRPVCQVAFLFELRDWFTSGRMPATWPRNGDATNP
jgi:hypothetical protein